MCGITGIYHFNKDREVNKLLLKSMNDIIKHRGPDGEGFYVKNNVGLGHRRLSIIDLDSGQQPMIFNDNVIVFNGEIYNYLELRDELIKKGHQFETMSDTEVILKSYLEWGVDCQNKFNGMWAFAIWDSKKELLFLSRDRIGEKPLHYVEFDDSIIFASEMKSIFQYGVPKVNDLSLLEVYFVMGYIPEPYSFYKGVKKLQAGHYILVEKKRIQEYKYWELPMIDEKEMILDKEYVYREFETLFNDSVDIRMRADVPFGAFLSGGLDSSSIVKEMAKISSYPVNTFTIGFDEKSYDESTLAEDVARKYNTTHFLGKVNPEKFDEILDRIVYHYDEPFGDTSAIPTGYVSKFARNKVKMVLTGDGGDELLSGYNSYAGIKFAGLYQNYPKFVQKFFPKMVSYIKSPFKGNLKYKLDKIQSVLETSLLPFEKRILEKKSNINKNDLEELLENRLDIIPVDEYFNEFLSKCTFKDEFYKLMYLNFKSDLPNGYLVKVDRMSMAYSLETRAPFLDFRLIELMTKVDKSVKMDGWERKSVLRNTIGKNLPSSILNAPKKGFDVPLTSWFRGNDFDNKIKDNLNMLPHIINNESINKLLLDNKKGVNKNGEIIWILMNLNKFIKNELG